MNLGTRIKKQREDLELSQEVLADQLGISICYLQAIERNVKIPRLTTFIKIANALCASTDYLLSDELDDNIIIDASWLSKKIETLEKEQGERILHVVEVMVNDAQHLEP